MQQVIVVHHHEIILKGENRRYFERQLMKNVRTSMRDIEPQPVVRGGYGRFVVEIPSAEASAEAGRRLLDVFGLANICPGVKVEQDLDSMCRAAESALEGREFGTIRVDTRRADKSFPTGSTGVNEYVGRYLCDRFSVRANLSRPDETVTIEIADGAAYVYRVKLKGAGGLPAGISGRAVALLSAGFDSPVAAWQVMRRGASVSFVHFHSMPYTSLRSVEQVREIGAVLTRYQYRSRLHLVPFADAQNEIVRRSPQPLRVVLYRRLMVRIAEAVATQEKAEALVTGESVGQVASQTLRNIRVIDAAASLPILRPLSGTDKEEIIALSRRIGTHDVSKEPYDDCCSYLAPRNPDTWSSPAEVEHAEEELDISALVNRSLQGMTTEVFTHPSVALERLVVESDDAQH